ncbi:MAG: biopolymer transporter ExbD [Verrucomicrobia bacterium]|nr:biopolymer transporter ExbD [Verrucomicrobiota bacterium]
MSIIPEEEIKRAGSLNLAPMVDFLFLVVAVFATLAVTRASLFDGKVELVKVKNASDDSSLIGQNDYFVVHLSVDKEGHYKWITEFNEYMLSSADAIRTELAKQCNLGLLPKQKEKTRVLLHIDKNAEWEPIAQVIFAVREAGFEIHPVYECAS